MAFHLKGSCRATSYAAAQNPAGKRKTVIRERVRSAFPARQDRGKSTAKATWTNCKRNRPVEKCRPVRADTAKSNSLWLQTCQGRQSRPFSLIRSHDADIGPVPVRSQPNHRVQPYRRISSNPVPNMPGGALQDRSSWTS